MKIGFKLIAVALCICLLLTSLSVAVSAATTTNYTSREDFIWGVNIHPTSYPDYNLDPELYVKASAELGVQSIRVNIGANLYDFSYIDRVVALCSSYNLKIIACVALSNDLDFNRSYYEKLARRYDGKSGFGYIDYYEIGGEEEVPLLNRKNSDTGKLNAGDSINHYYLDDVKTLQKKYASAIEGVKNSGTTAKTIIDFSHVHYAPLLYMYQRGLDFDIIGIDWYTNMGDISQVLTPVLRYFPSHEVIITETNLWSSASTDFNNLSEYNLLFDFMDKAYNKTRVKGLLFYELMDEPFFETQNNVAFHTESHFGLMYSLNNTTANPKPVYTYLQSVLGGGDITYEPVINKEYRALIDLEGTHNRFADAADWYYYYLGDFHMKENLSATNLSDSQFIELDIKIGDIDALKTVVNDKGLYLWLRLSSGANRYIDSSAASFTLQDLVSLGDDWYHLKLPMESFTRNEGEPIDWSAVKNWQFFIEGDNENTVDSLYSMDFYIRNICGTTPVASMPENVVAVLDENGCRNILGSYYVDIYAYFNKLGFEAVNLTNAEHIEFDIQFSDYEKIVAAIEENNIRLDFGLTSSGQPWLTRWAAADIFKYISYSGYGWYHAKIPMSAFNNTGGGGTIDWSKINSWLFTFEFSSGIATGENCGITMNIKNICATAPFAPEMPQNSILADKNGATSTLGDAYNYLWDILHKSIEAVDLSQADYIEFDIKYSNRDAIKSAIDAKNYVLCFNLTSSGGQWANRAVSGSIFNYETALEDGWYHYKIPKSAFGQGDATVINWANVNHWMFGFNYSAHVSTGAISNESITVKNICGTVYSLKSSVYKVTDGCFTVTQGTDISAISNAFVTGADIYNGTQEVTSGRVVTGMKAVIANGSNVYDSATIVVKNDISSDGYVNSEDLVILKKYLFETIELDAVQKFALCEDTTKEPDIRNSIKIKNEILNIF